MSNKSIMQQSKKVWTGMPECDNQTQVEFSKVLVRFSSAEDLEAFGLATGQKITKDTKSIWYPKAVFSDSATNLRYFDRDNIPEDYVDVDGVSE